MKRNTQREMKFHKFKLRHAQIIALCMAVYDFVTVIAAYVHFNARFRERKIRGTKSCFAFFIEKVLREHIQYAL